MNEINPKRWKIGLPIHLPEEVTDISTESEYITCMRKGFYKYGLRRGFEGKSYPIQNGLAYHKYRDAVEILMREEDSEINTEIHMAGVDAAMEGWEDPPLGHRYEWLDSARLNMTLLMARKRIEQEQKVGGVKVTRSEDAFDLELPFWLCRDCGYALLSHEEGDECPECGSTNIICPRHGGRVDQFVEFNGDYIRDFKTTSYMSRHHDKKFDPNMQVQGYVWAGSQLSGREFNGALIETVYNTKSRGPEIYQHFVNFSKGQQEQWIASRMMYRSFIAHAWSRVEELGYLAFPQNTNACTAMGLCPYRDACLMGSGREIDVWLKNFTIYSHWDFMAPETEESEV